MVKENLKNIWLKSKKNSALYNGRGIILVFLKKERPEKRRLDEGIKNLGLSKLKKTHY